MPDSWESFNEAYLGSHTDTTESIKSQELIKILLDKDKRRKNRDLTNTALISQKFRKGKGPSSKASTSPQNPDKSRSICHNCGKAGHYARDCWSKGGGKEGQRPGKPQNSAYQAGTADHESYAEGFEVVYTAIADIMHAATGPTDWIADTGATAHIAPIRELFSDYSVLSDNSIVRGVGASAKVLGQGTIKLSFNLGARKTAIHTLSNVLHIPSAPSCLLSIPKFNETVHG